MAELVTSIAQVIVAIGALIGMGGAGVYITRRKQNGQTALPGNAHDETIHELQGIRRQLRENGEANTAQHKDMMDTLAPRRVAGASNGESKKQ